MRDCPVTECKRNKDGFCPEGSCPEYLLYRNVTGKCETCDAGMDSHPMCDGCGILCGPGHLDWLPSTYRGHKLCGSCMVSWKALERVIGRKATWEESLNPKPQLLYERRS